ncbi:1,3-beta-glucanosyltransferase [Rhizina undulata]
MYRLGTAALAALTFTSLVSAVITQSVTVKGNAFFVGNDRFYIRGVDYQPGGSSDLSDPLANSDVCKRDIPVMKDLGINTIRVYTVDNSKNHKDCMDLLSEAGIYLILDVNTPKLSINREFPMYSYNQKYLQHVFATIDVFAQYPNTFGFFAANEVVNAANSTRSATIVKAVIRDMREYISKRIDRPIPVGYSAADVAENRLEMAHYLNCGDDAERSDFFAFNDYSWCGESSFVTSGWNQKVQNYSDYSIPLFLSEYGCNNISPRPFSEVKALYSVAMTGVFSGGLVYEYTQEPNNYGLVEVDGDSVTELQDYKNLKKQFEDTKNPSGDGNFQDDLPASECPEESDLWQASNTLPEMPADAQKYLTDGAGKPQGTSGTNHYVPPDGVDADFLSTPSSSSSSNSSSASSSATSGAAASGKVEMAMGGFWMSAIVASSALLGGALIAF